jgi:hypothetical protein
MKRQIVYHLCAMILFFGSAVTTESFANQKESYKDLISKSQNLSLQRDRLQACQILIRALQKETKNTTSYRELKNSLEELSSVFYTDKAQSIFSQGDSLVDLKTKEAIDKYQEALKLEEGNMSVFKALARAQLRLDDCRGAEATLKSAESFDPVSGEVQLLKLQTLKCQKDYALSEKLASKDLDLEGFEKYTKVFALDEAVRKKDFKKARQILSTWETQAVDYPEIYFWKWQIGNEQNMPDKASGEKYAQLCKALSVRKRKSFNLDVELCKNKDDVEAKIKTLKN